MGTDCSSCASAAACGTGNAAQAPLARTQVLQRRRRWLQLSFFAVFLLAPALNLLRFDLNETQLWVLGFRWSLGIDAFVRGEVTAAQTAQASGAIPWGPVAMAGWVPPGGHLPPGEQTQNRTIPRRIVRFCVCSRKESVS